MKKGLTMKKDQRFCEVVAILAVLTALSACSRKVQTVEWYQAHETERKAMVAECKNNPGEGQSDPNCINAGQAQFIGKPINTENYDKPIDYK